MKTISQQDNNNELLDFLIDFEINFHEANKVIIECKRVSKFVKEIYNRALTDSEYINSEFSKDVQLLYTAIDRDNISLFIKQYYV